MVADKHPLKRWEFVFVFMLIFLATVISVYLVDRESKARSNQNRDAIARTIETRRRLVRAFIAADLHTCREIEKLKAGFRQDAQHNYESLGKNLKLLHLERTPQIERAARNARNRVLHRYASRPGGCVQSPTK